MAKAKTNKTEIIVIRDRSGSMVSIIRDAIGGFNAMLKAQKEIPGEARMTDVQFDDQYETLFVSKDLQEVQELNEQTYVPRGGTALLDAVGRTINTHRPRIVNEKWADKVLLVIITDGEENSSREFTYASLQPLVAEVEALGWDIMYVGANQDALKVAKNLGVLRGLHNTVNYAADSDGTAAAYRSISTTMTTTRTT